MPKQKQTGKTDEVCSEQINVNRSTKRECKKLVGKGNGKGKGKGNGDSDKEVNDASPSSVIEPSRECDQHQFEKDDTDANTVDVGLTETKSNHVSDVIPESYSLEISTSQVSSFKTLIEALKELLIDTSIVFDETGMKIFTIDNKHIVIIYMKLEASEFERFYCKKPMSVGVNMIHFHKIIKTINNGDTLTLFMDSSESFGMNYLGIKIENATKNNKTTYKLHLYDIDPEIIEIQPIEYNSIITMPSNDFAKYIRDMSNLAQDVELRNIDNKLIFCLKGDICDQETILTDNPMIDENTGEVKRNITVYNKNIDNITQGVFNLKYLFHFTKCTPLSNTVELNLRNNFPLVVQYNIATLGHIRLCIAPTSQPDA